MTKLQALKIIDESKDSYLNKDQKLFAKRIINLLNEKDDIQGYLDFIMKRTGLGFKFDIAPDVAEGRIAVVNEMKEKRINVSDIVDENENKLIIGENYEALKNLLLTHEEKIDIIYIDPPYNTESAKTDGNNSSKEGSSSKFIYKDKFGRNGWLNMMRERLVLARRLLSPEGVIFVSIDDSEQAYLKVLMDEIFGEENFISNFIWERTHHSSRNNNGKKIFRNVDYILTYSKSNNDLKFFTEGVQSEFNDAPLLNKSNKENTLRFPKGKVFLKKKGQWNDSELVISFKSRWSQEKINSEVESGTTFIIKGDNFDSIRAIYHDDKTGFLIPSQLLSTSKKFLEKYGSPTTENGTIQLGSIFEKENIPFPYPKPIGLIWYLISLVPNSKNGFILDFFAGSGTTGHAVLELNKEDGGNRKFILVTNNENNIGLDVTYERLHRVIFGKTSEGQNDFDWLKNNKPFIGMPLRVFNIKHYNVETSEIDKLDEIKDEAIKNLKKLSSSYKPSEIVVYYDLDGLNPYNEEQLKQEYSTDPIEVKDEAN